MSVTGFNAARVAAEKKIKEDAEKAKKTKVRTHAKPEPKSDPKAKDSKDK